MLAGLLAACLGAAAAPPTVAAPGHSAQHVTKRLAHHGDLRLWRAARHDGAAMPVYTRTPGGAWTSALVPRKALPALLAEPELEVISQPPLAPRLDVSGPEIGAPLVHAGDGLDEPRTGKNVLVGIIDSGIDLGHSAFLDSEGESRIVAVWDQDRDGRHPPGFDYGAECTAGTLVTCAFDDPTSHGTHVAGIAAGSRELGGIAPDAKIAVVRSTDFTRIIDAVHYLFDVADALHMPLVVNLSVGGQYGARDGDTPLEQWLDVNLGKGKILVAAAGNGGNAAMHAGADLTTELQRLEVDGVPWGDEPTVHVDFWSSRDVSASIGVELWTDGYVAQRFTVTSADTDIVTTDLSVNGTPVHFDHASEVVGDRRHIEVIVDVSDGQALGGQAALVFALSGAGHVDAWVSRSDAVGTVRFGDRPKAGWVLGDGLQSIDVPASARSVIAVGSYTTRTTWPSATEGTQTATSLAVGAIAPYSSLGPTAAPQDTGVKPDISAPGSVIVSARARGFDGGVNDVDDTRTMMQGTSMAAPHVAGVVALMLEAKRDLTPSDVRRMLYASAREDAATGEVPNTTWGAGKIDARAAVARAEAEAGGCAAANPSLLALVAMLGALRRARRRI